MPKKRPDLGKYIMCYVQVLFINWLFSFRTNPTSAVRHCFGGSKHLQTQILCRRSTAFAGKEVAWCRWLWIIYVSLSILNQESTTSYWRKVSRRCDWWSWYEQSWWWPLRTSRASSNCGGKQTFQMMTETLLQAFLLSLLPTPCSNWHLSI